MITCLVEMHTEMAYRNNASTQVIKAMAQLGKPLNDALAAGLLTLDTIHAPIQQACDVFNHWLKDSSYILSYKKIPGFGSAWYKEEPDPVVQEFLMHVGPTYQTLVNEYTKDVQEHTQKALYPNAALATAVAAHILDLDPHMAMSLVIEGRLSAWVEIYKNNYVDRGF